MTTIQLFKEVPEVLISTSANSSTFTWMSIRIPTGRSTCSAACLRTAITASALSGTATSRSIAGVARISRISWILSRIIPRRGRFCSSRITVLPRTFWTQRQQCDWPEHRPQAEESVDRAGWRTEDQGVPRDTEHDEGYFVTSEISKSVTAGKSYQDHAICTDQCAVPGDRGNSDQIGYSVPDRRGIKFYDRKEIKDLLATFAWFPTRTTISVTRIINVPKEASATQPLRSWAELRRRGISIFRVLEIVDDRLCRTDA